PSAGSAAKPSPARPRRIASRPNSVNGISLVTILSKLSKASTSSRSTVLGAGRQFGRHGTAVLGVDIGVPLATSRGNCKRAVQDGAGGRSLADVGNVRLTFVARHGFILEVRDFREVN